ncbi:MAG: S66 peptidase family protein [Gemmatimonadaceae bacterium]
MSRSLRLPPPLGPGARIALLSPAGPLTDAADLARAEQNARALGWNPVAFPSALTRLGYLAGVDSARLADLNAAIRDPDIDGIWCIRGGYGTMRLLDAIDYDALAKTPKALIGYSDITALHCAIRARAKLGSYHGPNARGELTPFSRDSLLRAVRRDGDPFAGAPPLPMCREGSATGPLVGGNLALLCALMGTPYTASFDGAILCIEDVSEPLYRIDRMLHQLILSGALSRVAGLCIGSFTDRGDETNDAPRSLDVLFEEAAAHVRGPVAVGAPIGHLAAQWTLPLGARAELSARGLTLVSD